MRLGQSAFLQSYSPRTDSSPSRLVVSLLFSIGTFFLPFHFLSRRSRESEFTQLGGNASSESLRRARRRKGINPLVYNAGLAGRATRVRVSELCRAAE